MSTDKQKAAWQNILNKKRAEAAAKDAPPTPVNPDLPVIKNASTCGNVMCCMRQGGRAEVVFQSPTIIGADGLDKGGFNFKNLVPPMLCAGVSWQPKQPSKWEQRRRQAKESGALDEFKKR